MSAATVEVVCFDTVPRSTPIEELLRIPRKPAIIGSVALEDRAAFSSAFVPTSNEEFKQCFFSSGFVVGKGRELLPTSGRKSLYIDEEPPEFLAKIILAQAHDFSLRCALPEESRIQTLTEVRSWAANSPYTARESVHFDGGKNIYSVSDSNTVFYTDCFEITEEQFASDSEAMKVLAPQISNERSVQPEPYDNIYFDDTLPHASPDRRNNEPRTWSRTNISVRNQS